MPRGRIAYLTFSPGTFDARMLRMARTARAAGYDVTVYARWHAGLPQLEEREGIRIIRAPFNWRLAVPFLREGARRREALAIRTGQPGGSGDPEARAVPLGPAGPIVTRRRRASLPRRMVRMVRRRLPSARSLMRAVLPRGLRERLRERWRLVKMFPINGIGWAAALEDIAEPADIWHGMWAGSLPALTKLRRQHGGHSIYDSRDVYMHSRGFADLQQPLKWILTYLERRWARRVDRVITVNRSYAQLLAKQFGMATPAVVMNLPYRWNGPSRDPDLIRDALALPESTAIVLYQGGLMSDRGIEQAMDAILEIPEAVLCLLGFGPMRDQLIDRTATAPYAGRVYVLDPVPPERLLEWTASADVSVMAIQPTSTNHAYTTPQKLFESIAVGVPVVASDLPGMSEIVGAVDAGVLCDPTDPAAIARGIRELLDAPAAVKLARRTRILDAARDRYNWEAETPTLLAIYAELLSTGVGASAAVSRVGAGDAAPAAAARSSTEL
jgi:glycosyltransferase involved in cell wall biosynthesis